MRFRSVADALYDGNKSELARALDMEPGSFTKYTRGARRPGASVLERLTQLGVNINWFLTGEGSMMNKEKQPSPSGRPLSDAHTSMSASGLLDNPSQYYPLPHVEVRVGKEGEVYFDEIGDPEWVSAAFIRRQYDVDPERLCVFRAACNAMANTIRPGDRIRAAFLSSNQPDESIISGNAYVLRLSQPVGFSAPPRPETVPCDYLESITSSPS